MNELTEGIHYYINEDGFIVFTEQYHLERGYCCGNGCKHCPYQYENVNEPKRTYLLQVLQAHKTSEGGLENS